MKMVVEMEVVKYVVKLFIESNWLDLKSIVQHEQCQCYCLRPLAIQNGKH